MGKSNQFFQLPMEEEEGEEENDDRHHCCWEMGMAYGNDDDKGHVWR